MKPLIGIASLFCLLVNMIFWSSLLFLFALLRLIIPSRGWKKLWTSATILIGEACIACNSSWIKILHRPSIIITGMENLKKDHWYIATSNHQSWGDIFVLQKITNKKVPLLRFFMKDVLKWIPIVSIVGWALDMPFLKRYSKEQVEKNPSLRGKDLEQMKKAFKRLETNPGTVLSFAEGTRFTKLKHDDQQSPFKNLLRPKAGGIGITLSTMPFITTLLDFSISYESKTKSFWDFLCGRMSVLSIKIRVIEIPKNLLGNNYSKEKGFRDDLKNWLYEIWEAKEEFLNSA